MTKAESLHVRHGLYRIHWRSGGSSLAAIGILPNGDRWIAPVNWVHPSENQHIWRQIARLDLVTNG